VSFQETRRRKCNLPENADSSNGNSPEKGRASQKSLTLGTEIRRKMDRPVRIIDFGNGTSPENRLFSANVPSSPKEKKHGEIDWKHVYNFLNSTCVALKMSLKNPKTSQGRKCKNNNTSDKPGLNSDSRINI